MVTVGSMTREKASLDFPFLANKYRARRKAIKEFTHMDPDFVFWIYPNGDLLDAIDSHRKNPPKGHEYILDDEPNYGGFLRGRVASNYGPQIIVVYCNEDDLVSNSEKIVQFASGLSKFPIPIEENVLVVSDNADIYGTVSDVKSRCM